MLLAALTVGAGCSLGAGRSPYQVVLPVLKAEPAPLACLVNAVPATCVILEQGDYRSLVRELKAACLALGGSPEDCQTE